MQIEQFLIDRIHPDWLECLDFGGYKNRTRHKLPNGSFLIHKFRKTVRERFQGKCAKCKSIRNLEAHHIKPIEYVSHRMSPYQNNSIDNGMLLCKPCHRREHRAMVLSRHRE